MNNHSTPPPCCEKCYSTYTTDDWPSKQTLDACIDQGCICHSTPSVDTPPPTDTMEEIAKEAHIKWLLKAETAKINGSEMTVLPYGYLKTAVKEAIALAVKNREEEIVEKLQNWLEHDYRCSLKQFYEQFSAGRPTEDGGYEQKWDGKWYQSRPVNELPKPPKCDCGLDDALSLLKDKGVK